MRLSARSSDRKDPFSVVGEHIISRTSRSAFSSRAVSPAVDHPHLIDTVAATIRTFLRKYDQYMNVVLSLGQQVSCAEESILVVRPVDIKFFVDVDFVEFSIDLCFVPDSN